MKLDEDSIGQVRISWSIASVIHGFRCIQAFEVEQKQYGRGQRSWTQWSSLAACAILVRDRFGTTRNYVCHRELQDMDCGKREELESVRFCRCRFLEGLQTLPFIILGLFWSKWNGRRHRTLGGWGVSLCTFPAMILSSVFHVKTIDKIGYFFYFFCASRIRFRIVLHNVFNVAHPKVYSKTQEAKIQCKYVPDQETRERMRPALKKLKKKNSNSRMFFVRTPNREQFNTRSRHKVVDVAFKRPRVGGGQGTHHNRTPEDSHKVAVHREVANEAVQKDNRHVEVLPKDREGQNVTDGSAEPNAHDDKGPAQAEENVSRNDTVAQERKSSSLKDTAGITFT